ncbi:MAG TPA: adenylate/guanylate cyclase domain-containing protein [Candidatus Dormibacteraeota bacterium]|nr:adenylate/guanylate cyclase domain-containing protein [Candidatus Dormibacteraeota bacterium]
MSSASYRIRQTNRRRALLEAYVAPEVVAHILSNGRTPLLSGVRLPVTVLFADIRNFTRASASLPAERVVALLDDYFDVMTAAAMAHGAMVDKLIGDAVMVVFGIPPAQGTQAQRALYTPDAMHRGFQALLGRWRRRLPASLHLGLGIGCASGDAVLANVGSFTLIGAPVNLAARLKRPVLAYAACLSVDRPVFVPRVSASDPVCGMKLPAAAALRVAYRRKTYLFCSPSCHAAFRRNPARYAAGPSARPVRKV